MKKIQTEVGVMTIRNDWDKAVIKEVIQDREYERWGDIKIKKGDYVIDCGAHIGSFSLTALHAGARVLAIEPDESNFDLLKKNTEKYKTIDRLKAVLWDGKPVNFLSDKERGELSTVNGAGKPMASVTLNDLVDRFKIKQINLLKMDIEGAEYKVLSEFKYFNRVKQITMEWHYGASRMTWLILFLEDHGFKTVWLGGNGLWGKLQFKRK